MDGMGLLQMFEDAGTNRMTETLNLFEEIVNSPHLSRCAIILFLNKRDLFQDKVSGHQLRCLSVTLKEYYAQLCCLRYRYCAVVLCCVVLYCVVSLCDVGGRWWGVVLGAAKKSAAVQPLPNFQ